ncbi:MAG: hypothetical protein K6E63_03340 [Lachnospiraceae bacterium]|nr:hypothetical protein [Lachnospiraceae bacterium]
MLICTMQGSVVAASTELADVVDESVGTVPGDSFLADADGEAGPLGSGSFLKDANEDEPDVIATEGVLIDSDPESSVFEADVKDGDWAVTYEDSETVDLQALYMTLKMLASVSEGKLVSQDELSQLIYTVNADEDAAGKPDVVIELEGSIDPVSISSATIFRHPGATVSGDVYTVSAGGDAPYSELKFTFYNTVFWYHAATYADGSVSQPGYGGFKTVSGSIVNDWDPAFVISGHKLSEAISEFPKVVKTGYTLKYWGISGDLETDPEEITLSTNITKPFVLATAVWEEEKIPHIHEWEFDKVSANVVWTGNDTDGYTKATIKKTCKSVSHNVADDGPVKVDVSSDKITVSNNGAKCGEQLITYYTATFDHDVDEAIPVNEPFSFVKTVSGQTLSHNWTVSSVSSNGSYEIAPTTASLNIVCERDKTHTEIVTVSGSGIELVSSNELKKIYKYTGTASDGQTVSANEEFLGHTEHKWTVSFNWISISSNKADTNVTAEATCKVGGEKKSLEVTLDDKQVGSKIEYTAKATVRPEKYGPAKRILIPRHAR